MNKVGTQTIETDRLILRRFTVEDARDMYDNWASDPEVTKFLTWPTHTSVDVTKALLTDWVSRYEDGGYFNWVMEYKDTGKAIGNISVVKLNENTQSADMGYCMGRSYWGMGLMPEALKAVMDYLFDVVEINRVAACHDVNNPKSGRVMEKAGMKQEGILRGAGRNNQGICDEVWHAMVRSDREHVADNSRIMVLLVIDTQKGITDERLYGFKELEENITTLIDTSRKNGVEVVFVQHDDGPGSGFSKGDDDFEIYEGFAPADGEKIFEKSVNSAFHESTGLDLYLKSKNVSTVIIVGLQTDYCVDATVKSGFEKGYNIIVPEYCNSTRDNPYMDAKTTYEFFNKNMWPGRYAKCVSVDETLKMIHGGRG